MADEGRNSTFNGYLNVDLGRAEGLSSTPDYRTGASEGYSSEMKELPKLEG